MGANAFCIVCGSPLFVIFGRGSAKMHGLIVCSSCKKKLSGLKDEIKELNKNKEKK